jgi:hypothetical protein
VTTPDDPNDEFDFEFDAELAALLRDPTMWDEPTVDLRGRVVAAVEREVALVREPVQRRDDRLRTPSPSLPSSLSRGRVKPGGALAVQPRRWLAAAAAVLVAFGAWTVLQRRGSEEGGAVQFALAATDLIPGAAGDVAITSTESGLRIELDATGLPRRDGTRFYQAWLKGESGLVPIGTFHSGEDVTLWAGVSLDDFPTLTITEEEVGDQESSGRRVLVGTRK